MWCHRQSLIKETHERKIATLSQPDQSGMHQCHAGHTSYQCCRRSASSQVCNMHSHPKSAETHLHRPLHASEANILEGRSAQGNCISMIVNAAIPAMHYKSPPLGKRLTHMSNISSSGSGLSRHHSTTKQSRHPHTAAHTSLALQVVSSIHSAEICDGYTHDITYKQFAIPHMLESGILRLTCFAPSTRIPNTSTLNRLGDPCASIVGQALVIMNTLDQLLLRDFQRACNHTRLGENLPH